VKRRDNSKIDRTALEIINRIRKFIDLVELGKLITNSDSTRYLSQIDSDDGAFTYNRWTLLKLLFLYLYVPLYTSIIRKNFAEFNYIDAFAGSGVNKLADTPILIPGSPIIALAMATSPYANIYLVEKDSSKRNLLKRRVDLLIRLSKDPRYREIILTDLSPVNVIYKSDITLELNQMFATIEKRHEELYANWGKGCHNLVFIDPFGLQFPKTCVERIINSKVRSDIIMFFNTRAVGMQAYNALYERKSVNVLDSFLGPDWKKNLQQLIVDDRPSPNEIGRLVRDFYVEQIKKKDRIVEVIELPIREDEEYNRHFDLIYSCRKTKGGNPFLQAIEYIKDYIRKTGYKFMDQIFEYITTKELPLELYQFTEDPQKLLEKYSLSRRYGVLQE